MEFTIKNCNNIEEGNIKIIKNKLNIKYGINGTGKSTIVKAIKYKIETHEKLNELIPFKLRSQDNQCTPEVIISEEINNVLIFNEEYLNQFLFKKDELISNSYEIFIKTPEYTESILQIEQFLADIKKVFDEDKSLEKIITDFDALSKSFATTQSGLSKTSHVFKGLQEGNTRVHIPEALKGYSKLITNNKCISWLDWQIKGEPFLEISDDCPYCTNPTNSKKDIIKSVSKVYDKNIIKNFNIIIDSLKSLGDYFSEDASKTLKTITEKHTGLTDAEMNYIVTVKQQIDDLLLKLKALKNISPSSFIENERAEDKLNNLIISIDLFDRLKSDKTTTIIHDLNTSLSTVLGKVGLLQGEINKQKKLVEKLIRKHQEDINSFLTNAGYKYMVEITSNESKDYKLHLKHTESSETINGGQQHLSFGEKNAFALVLFMYEALSKTPDLIVLDDPISSFDKNKKYAIMHMLFRGGSAKCIKNKTVLMLTHDLDPIIDTVKILKEFNNLSISTFLTTKKGMLSETGIEKKDLMTFSQICYEVMYSDVDNIIKSIYLRRYFEVLGDLSNGYQVLSNLFHKRTIQALKDTRETANNNIMSTNDYNLGVIEIRKHIDSFDYIKLLTKIDNNDNLRALYNSSKNSYAKLNIFKLFYSDSFESLPNVLRKFINETYHIENELICQLDHNKFDLIPDFIIKACDNYVLDKLE